jgi:hypothetical protein
MKELELILLNINVLRLAYQRALEAEKAQVERVSRLEPNTISTRIEQMLLSAIKQNTIAALSAFTIAIKPD